MRNNLQNTAVKIATQKNGNNNFGSGTIVQINSSYYVITAEHCVFGKKEDREKFKDVTVNDITIEHRKTFNEQPMKIAVVSIIEKSESKDYIILQINPPAFDFNFGLITFGTLFGGNDKCCYLRGYAKAHENDPRDYKCRYIEKSNQLLLLQLNDTLNNPVNSGIEVASGLSGSGIFYIEGESIYLIGIFTCLRDEQGTYDDFFALSIDSVTLLSDKIVTIESDLFRKSANNLLVPFQTKLGIPNVDFVLSEIHTNITGSHIAKRDETIHNLGLEFSRCNWLMISGPIYSGKTELLKLLSSSFGEAKSLLIKISADETEKTIIERIQAANDYKREVIIIDNLPQLKNESRLLAFLIQISQEPTIKIITSSRFTLPIIIKSYSDIIPKTIPDFTTEEVVDIIRSYNQPDEIVNMYGTFILTRSRKNPAIISSLCSFFDNRNWKIDIDDFTRVINGGFDNEFQIELNEELHNTVTDQLNRELLNRLQLHIGSFEHKIVDLTGKVSPEIPELNSRFLRLVGTWILPSSPDQFIISPLLQIINNGNPDLSFPTSQNINIALAESIIHKKTLNQFDVQNIILYYMRANKPNEAGYFYVRFMIDTIDNIEYLKKSILSYYWIDIPLPDEMDVKLKIQIRFFQLHFLRSVNRNTTYILTELEGLSKNAEIGIDAFLVNSLLGTSYSNPEELNPKAFRYLIEAQNNLSYIKPEILQYIQQSRDNVEMLWFTFSQIVSQSDIDEWFSLLDSTIITNDLMKLESSKMYESTTFFFFRRFKENASKEIEKKQNCNQYFQVLGYLLDKLRAYQLDETKLQTLCLVIQLYDLSGKKQDALKIFWKELNSFEKTEHRGTLYFAIITTRLLEDKKITIDLLTDEIQLILTSTVKIKSGSSIILDGLCVLTSHYKDIDIKKSLHYSELAYDYSINDDKDFEVISQTLIAGEYAIALWVNNKREACVKTLDIGFTKLLSIVSDDDKYKVLVLKYGILIRYIALQNKEDGDSFVIPEIGMFFLNPNPDKLIEIYDPIRDYFNCQFMFDIHKKYNNIKNVNDWALRSYNLAKEIPNNPFSKLMLCYIPYLIENKLYEDVINVLYKEQEEVERKKVGKSIYYELMKRLQPERDFSEEIIPIHNSPSEEENLGLYVIPMLIDALKYYQGNKNDIEYLNKIVYVLKNHVAFSSNKSLIEECIDILENFINNKAILDYNFSMKNDSNALKCIVYLLSSLSQNEKKAFELQMSIIVYLDKSFDIFEFEKDMLLYPFFRTFWLNRIDEHLTKFENYKHLQEKGLKQIVSGSGKSTNRLFKILSDHITIKLNTNQEDWLDS